MNTYEVNTAIDQIRAKQLLTRFAEELTELRLKYPNQLRAISYMERQIVKLSIAMTIKPHFLQRHIGINTCPVSNS